MAEAPGAIPPEPSALPVSLAARNVLTNWAAFLVTSLISFFLSPYLVRQLGDSGYGVWVLIGSLTSYLGLLDLGVRGAVTRYLARFHAREDHGEASRVVSSALAVFLVIGVLAVLLSGVVALAVLDFFRIPAELQPVARMVLLLAGFTVAVSLVGGVFGGVVVGLQRFDLSNAVEMVIAVARGLVIVAALWAGQGLLALAVIHLVFALAGGATYAVLTLRLYPNLRVHPGWCDREHLRLIFSFSLFAFLLHVSNYLIFYTNSVVIGAFLPVSMVTLFAIAGNLVNYSRALISGISTTMTPLTSAIQAVGMEWELRRVLLRATRFASLLILPIAITFWLRGSSFINLWMGPGYGESSGRVLRILTLSLVFAAAGQVATSAILGIGRHKPLVPLALAEALTNLGLSIVLVRKMGIDGVAWGTTLPSLASSLIFWPWYVRRIIGIGPGTYVMSTWLRPGVAMLAFATGMALLERYWSAENLGLFFLQVVLVLPLAGVGTWLMALEPEDRQNIWERLLLPAIGAWRRRG